MENKSIDCNNLPNNLETTTYKAILTNLGYDCSKLPNNLKTTILKEIGNAIANASGGSSKLYKHNVNVSFLYGTQEEGNRTNGEMELEIINSNSNSLTLEEVVEYFNNLPYKSSGTTRYSMNTINLSLWNSTQNRPISQDCFSSYMYIAYYGNKSVNFQFTYWNGEAFDIHEINSIDFSTLLTSVNYDMVIPLN